MFKGIDLYSDTATRPSMAMKKAMMDAELGDEQRGEDPTTRQLEEMAAEMLGHEATMFFPSATMANEIALRFLTEPGDELIAADECHLFFAEAGGPAILSGLMTRPIHTQTGIFTGDDLRAIYRRAKGSHYPVSKIVSVENTTNMNGGIAWDIKSLQSVLTVADELSLKKHLDGSRLFNAAIKTGTSALALASPFDTVTICLSKGLGCPVGALLAYPKANFDKVRRLKQLFGGAMRQSGMLAAAGIYALQNNIQRLAIDHENATKLAAQLHEEVPQIKVENIQPSTNMVFFSLCNTKLTHAQFNEACIGKGARFSVVGENRFRAVTHLDINTKDIEKTVAIIKEILSEL
jgi:threonine aldolase